ncbi:fungal-specific transcription factor domain-containing protein [Lenzites betulinus]|nr:fungal-specific transcription factor domain-containing protein [Lenzites betulinus]
MDPPSAAQNAPAKTPVHRGARACTVCRQAKMKCVGAEDGTQPCQRCQRAGVACVFEKHRRGRKPGSKLSEASKMLRRLEKGLNNAKAKQPASSPRASPSATQYGQDEGAGPSNLQGSSSQQFDDDMDDEEEEHPSEGLYAEKVIRSSFLDIVMNPEPPAAAAPEQSRPRSGGSSDRAYSEPKAPSHTPTRSQGSPQPKPYGGLFSDRMPQDPVSAGIIREIDVVPFFDMFFLRLNSFVNLFDPSLHSHEYVRSRSPFLFTAMLMACCKFFKPAIYPEVRRLAEQWSIFTFAEGIETVETVQALACMTYWKEPTDRRTWSYIGMACRMAVNLRLNKYVGRRQPNETALHFLERRNKERTYLVLFVHDRSLSMQTGKHWMLHEDEFVRNAGTWHEDGCAGTRGEVRPEDVIVAAFVQLRLIGSEATDTFFSCANVPPSSFHPGTSFNKELRKCNNKLDVWSEHWDQQLRHCSQADGFHSAFIQFFQSHVRLFLNTFGLNVATPDTRTSPDPEAVEQCERSACKNLHIITEFDKLHVLQYCQESITVMTAYAAIVLLRVSLPHSHRPTYADSLSWQLLRTSASPSESAVEQIHGILNSVADAYQNAGHITGSSIDSAVFHSRFLRRLVAADAERARQQLDRSGFRAEALPPLFAQTLPPLQSTQSSSTQQQPRTEFYPLSRPAHAHQAAPLPPLSMIGPSNSHMSAFAPSTNGAIDHRNGGGMPYSSNNRSSPTNSSSHSVTESDVWYWNYMVGEVKEFPQGDSAAAHGGFINQPFMGDIAGYAPVSHAREHHYPSSFNGYSSQSRSSLPHPYLPSVQSFGHAAYDTSR